MILRELLAVFGLDYDDKGQKKAEKGVQTLKEEASSLQMAFTQALGAAAISAPFLYLTKMASDAQENLNLLQLSFGESAQGIVEWSAEASQRMNRSRYTLRELTAEFGGLLAPMVGVGAELAEMSKGLTELTVDLSSARNVTENEALSALQSGLAGNIIAMKRFGVNLSAVRVEQEAVNRGWGKSAKSLTQAQLATIRYSLITKDLAFIQGDAANTSDQFANASRGVRDGLKDIGTEIGLFLLPAFESSLRSTREMLGPLADMARGFRDWAADTNLAKAVVMSLSAIVTGMLLPTLFKMLPVLAAFGVAVLIIDELITAFEGGNTVVGEFTNMLDTLEKDGFTGMGTAAKVVIQVFNRFRDAIGATMAVLFNLYEGLTTGDFTSFWRIIESNRESFDKWMDSMGKWGKAIKSFINLLMSPLTALGGILAAITEAIFTGSTAPLKGIMSGLKGLAADSLKDAGNISNAFTSPQGQKFTGGGAPQTLGSSGLSSRTIGIQQGNTSIALTIQQSAGESSEDFAKRVAAIIAEQEEQRDQALYYDLVQATGAP